MSFAKKDCIPNTMQRISSKGVRALGNTITPITHIGTISWKVYNDDGVIRSIVIPNFYYIPNGSSRLLSPQHWSQQAADTFPIRHGTWCATYDDLIVCHWDQKRYQMTIPPYPGSSNVGTIHTATGYNEALHIIEEKWESAQDIAWRHFIIQSQVIKE
jgi:hypothetical protein